MSVIETPGKLDWSMMSRAARDAAYNNTEHVRESATLVAAREAASAAFRAAHPALLDIPYGPRERNRWDLFPASTPDAPCLVFVHGGYWQRNSRETFACLVEGARQLGWSAALPGYTLAPEASLTEIVAELRASLDWLASHGPSHGIEGPILLSGWSAGGHLTAMCLDHPAVSAGLSISGVFELGPLRDTYLNEKLQLSDEEIISLSPLRHPAVQKPLALAYGTAELDALAAASRVFHAHRAGQHAPGLLLPVPHANHFTILQELAAPSGHIARHLPLIIGAA